MLLYLLNQFNRHEVYVINFEIGIGILLPILNLKIKKKKACFEHFTQKDEQHNKLQTINRVKSFFYKTLQFTDTIVGRDQPR